MKHSEKILIASASLLMVGGGFFLSKFQEGRYFTKDLNKILAKQESERDYTRLKKRYKISDEELEKVVYKKKPMMKQTENVVDNNPDWENVRAPRRFEK